MTVCEQLGLWNSRIVEPRTGTTSSKEPLSGGFHSISSRNHNQETIGNTFATPSITIHRSQADYTPTLPSGSARNAQREALERVFVAIGSNIGDRVANITKAVRLLEEAGCKVLDTSRLYESEPMYVEDQDRFVNGVIEVG